MAARRAPQLRRTEILDAACRVIETRGFASTRVSDVASALGVSSALVFYHFASKDNLLVESFRHAAEKDLGRLEQLIGSGRPAGRRLSELLRLYAPGGNRQAWVLWIDGWSQALRLPQLAGELRRLDVRWKQAFAAVIADGVATGQFRCQDPAAAAWRLTALIDGLAVQATVHPAALSRRRLAGWVRAMAAVEVGTAAASLSP